MSNALAKVKDRSRVPSDEVLEAFPEMVRRSVAVLCNSAHDTPHFRLWFVNAWRAGAFSHDERTVGDIAVKMLRWQADHLETILLTAQETL